MSNIENKEFAPIFLSVYDRVDHFKKCLQSLASCSGADKSVLYIASDGPRNKIEGKKVAEIREYIRNFKGFKEIIVNCPNTNTNKKVIKDTYNEIFSKYDRLIRAEDDNIFSRDFIEFVNEGLIVYNYNEQIYSISGYGFPIDIPTNYQQDVYFWKGYVAWGVGLWREKLLKRSKNIDDVKAFLSNGKQVKAMKKISENNVFLLKNLCNSNKLPGDVLASLHIFRNNMYSVFPVETRVKNIGFDGSGMNCGKSKIDQEKYHNQKISDNINTVSFPETIIESSVINKLMRKYSKVPLKRKLRRMFNNLKNKFIICIL